MTRPWRDAEPFRRTRRDHADEKREDYIEAIDQIIREEGECRVSHLARKFDVTHVTVSRFVAKLCEEGLVLTEPYKPVELTKAGESMAEQSRRRHDLVVRFLIAIGVEPATAHADAEGIEHHVSPETLDRFRSFLAARTNPLERG